MGRWLLVTFSNIEITSHVVCLPVGGEGAGSSTEVLTIFYMRCEVLTIYHLRCDRCQDVGVLYQI